MGIKQEDIKPRTEETFLRVKARAVEAVWNIELMDKKTIAT